MNNAGLGWATFISSLGAQVPGVLQQYEKDQEKQRVEAIKKTAAGIMSGIPTYGANMDPDQAVQVLNAASPEDKAQAAQILSSRGALPKGFFPQQDASMYPAAGVPLVAPQQSQRSALAAMVAPQQKNMDDETMTGLLNTIGQMESGGDYAKPHPEPPGGPDKQAYGKYGIQASTWFKAFPQFGLDASKPEDIQRFIATPALQDAMSKEIVKQGLDSAGGDMRKFRAWYYGGPGAMAKIGTADEWKPVKAYKRVKGRATREEIQMPSIGADADKFLAALKSGGVDASSVAVAGPGGAPYDNAALLDLIKEKPQAVSAPRRVTYQDQERYLLEKAKTPELASYLKDYTSSVSKLADRERDDAKEGRASFEKAQDRYDRNVTEVAKQALEVWKTKYNFNKARGSAARDQHLANLKELRTEMQQRLKDISSWSVNYLKADEEQKKVMASLYPEFFSKQTETSFFGGSKQVAKLNPNAMEKETLRLRDMIDKIGAETATKGGVDYIEGDAGKEKPPSDFFING